MFPSTCRFKGFLQRSTLKKVMFLDVFRLLDYMCFVGLNIFRQKETHRNTETQSSENGIAFIDKKHGGKL